MRPKVRGRKRRTYVTLEAQAVHLVQEIRRKERNITERAAVEKLAADERQRELKASMLEIAAKKKRLPFSRLRKIRLPRAVVKEETLRGKKEEKERRLKSGEEEHNDNGIANSSGCDDKVLHAQRDYELAYDAVNQNTNLSAREKLMRRSSFAEEEAVTTMYGKYFGGADRPQGTYQKNPADRQTLLRLHSEDAVRYEADLDRRLWLSVTGATAAATLRSRSRGGGVGRRRSSRNRDRPWTSDAATKKEHDDQKKLKGKKQYQKPAPSIETLLSKDLKPLFRRASSASERARRRSPKLEVRILEKQIGRALKGHGSKEWGFLIDSWGKASPRLRNGAVNTTDMAPEDMLDF